MSDALHTTEAQLPRFEFRSFGQDFEKAGRRMARLSVPVPERLWERTSNEIYIISRVSDTCNAKIRDGKMQIKALVEIVDGLEQWAPVVISDMPLTAATLSNELFPHLQVTPPGLYSNSYTCPELVGLIRRHPHLQAVHVRKQRFAYRVNDTICETGIILVNGARIMTISTESASIEQVKKTINDLGLNGTENINYLQAIKRVTGMISKPLAN